MLAVYAILLLVCVARYAGSRESSMLFAAAGTATGIHGIVLDALHPPLGGLRSGLLTVGVGGFAVALALAGH
jgi:hypothetical protein